jgi:paraquat-inducible protein A
MPARRNKQSLAHTGHHRRLVPALIVTNFAALAVSYFLPFMVISKFFFWEDDYTLFSSIFGMWEDEHYFLAVVIFAFSVVFPLLKLVALTLAWFVPAGKEGRDKLLSWLSALGKWSMLDVFVVALVIVLTQSKSLLDAEPRPGIYVFAGAILLSMLVTMLVRRTAKR